MFVAIGSFLSTVIDEYGKPPVSTEDGVVMAYNLEVV